jgi:hypothetical protein
MLIRHLIRIIQDPMAKERGMCGHSTKLLTPSMTAQQPLGRMYQWFK